MPLHPYRTAGYGRTFGDLFPVHVSGTVAVGWLKRPIPETDTFDLAGPYPCLSVSDHRALADEVMSLRGTGAVSVVFVTSAFEESSVARDLARLTICRPFKTHYLVRFDRPWREHLSAHHARELQRAARNGVEIRIFATNEGYADTFWPLYEVLIARHGIAGIQALGPQIVAAQFGLPGMLAIEAVLGGEVIASSIWAHDDREAHLHLHAQTERAYRLCAGYLLYEAALDHFSTRLAQVDLGGAAGLADRMDDGLGRFKRGWSNAMAQTYLCGEILDEDCYRALTEARGAAHSAFFPQYRSP